MNKKTVATRLDVKIHAEIEQACIEFNESKCAMIAYLIERGLHEYRTAKTRDQNCRNILQVLGLQQASTNSSTNG